jgi:hypothetical protein
LSLTVFEKIALEQLITKDAYNDAETQSDNQLNLFD